MKHQAEMGTNVRLLQFQVHDLRARSTSPVRVEPRHILMSRALRSQCCTGDFLDTLRPSRLSAQPSRYNSFGGISSDRRTETSNGGKMLSYTQNTERGLPLRDVHPPPYHPLAGVRSGKKHVRSHGRTPHTTHFPPQRWSVVTSHPSASSFVEKLHSMRSSSTTLPLSTASVGQYFR